MSQIQKILLDSIKDHIGSYDLFVIKGFRNVDLQYICTNIRHSTGELPLDTMGNLDLQRIQDGFSKTITGVINSSIEDPSVLEFESFFQLASNTNIDQLNKKFLIIENSLLREYPNQCNMVEEDFESLVSQGKTIPEDSPFHQFYASVSKTDDIVLIQYIDGLEDQFSSISWMPLFPKKNPELIPFAQDLEIEHYIMYQPLNHEYLLFKLRINEGIVPENLNILLENSVRQQERLFEELKTLVGALDSLGSKVKCFVQDPRLKNESRSELQDLLKNHWKSDSFRTLQVYKDPDINNELIEVSQGSVVEEVIQQFENGQSGNSIRDIFLTAPTGAGKSLLFQLPAIYIGKKYNAVTIVISPLIALMKDQVIALREDRHYQDVAFINSELSLLEREEVLENVHNGNISILYLSPELLLSYELSMFIGQRSLGLLVIDEAHLVTTWGRDFRVDYWYLGNYIRKIRRYYDYKFPVMAVTATAVYNGPNDMAFETLDSLSMENAIMYVGKVRRDNIDFEIKKVVIEKSHEDEKNKLTALRIQEFESKFLKTIVYCPWTSQLQQIKDKLETNFKDSVGLYYGGLNREIKNETYERFKKNEIKTIISTKAFGMGVDIDDITCVYHHAPSGHLADYVQEVGRLARKETNGTARIDFNNKDLKFTKILYGLSSIKQYQVSMVLEKLLRVYDIKKTRNLLVSVDDFQYIFNFEGVDVDQKVKSSLLLLEKDLLSKYRYNVLIARPKSLFSTVYARVNKNEREEFFSKYKAFCKIIPDRKIENKGQLVVKIELDRIWEKYHSDISFPLIKKQFFDKTLFEEEGLYVSPQLRLGINLNQSSTETFDLLTKYFGIVEYGLTQMGGKFFTKVQFTQVLNQKFQNHHKAKRISDLILSIYGAPVIAKGRYPEFTKPECFIQTRRMGSEMTYRVFQSNYPKVKSSMRKRFNRMFGNLQEGEKDATFFIPTRSEKNIGMIQLAYVLESFDLGTYEMSGGEQPSIFIRLNDPSKLKWISKKGYTNDILREVDRRQKTSVQIMEYFFTKELTTEERWTFIEDYFLGKTADELISVEVEEDD